MLFFTLEKKEHSADPSQPSCSNPTASTPERPGQVGEDAGVGAPAHLPGLPWRPSLHVAWRATLLVVEEGQRAGSGERQMGRQHGELASPLTRAGCVPLCHGPTFC